MKGYHYKITIYDKNNKNIKNIEQEIIFSTLKEIKSFIDSTYKTSISLNVLNTICNVCKSKKYWWIDIEKIDNSAKLSEKK